MTLVKVLDFGQSLNRAPFFIVPNQVRSVNRDCHINLSPIDRSLRLPAPSSCMFFLTWHQSAKWTDVILPPIPPPLSASLPRGGSVEKASRLTAGRWSANHSSAGKRIGCR